MADAPVTERLCACGNQLPPLKRKGHHRRLCDDCRRFNKRESDKKNYTRTGRNARIKPGEHLSRDTEFKKGQPSLRAVPMFTERRDRRSGYILIKIPGTPSAPSARALGQKFRWVAKHRWLWETEHGAVPAGSVIAFADGDRSNFQPNNIVCVPKQVLVRMNRKNSRANPGIQKARMALARLQTQLQTITKTEVPL